MSVESATYISDLNASVPGATDLKAEGDDHLRLIKSVLKTTFPAFSGALTPTHVVFNNIAAGAFPTVPLSGVTSLLVNTGTALETVTVAGGIAATGGYTHSPAVSAVRIGTDGGSPSIGFTFASAPTDSKLWEMYADSTTLVGRLLNDGLSSSVRWLAVTRSGMTVSSVALTGPVTATSFNGKLATSNVSQWTNDSGYVTSSGSVASATTASSATNATNASNVPWTGVSGRPSALSQFTNDSGFLTGISVNNVVNYSGSNTGNGSDVTGFTLSASGGVLTATTTRTYRTAPDPGGAG